MSGGGAEREWDTESDTGSRLRAVSTEPDAGLELTNRDHDLSQSRTINRLSQAPPPDNSAFLNTGLPNHQIKAFNPGKGD